MAHLGNLSMSNFMRNEKVGRIDQSGPPIPANTLLPFLTFRGCDKPRRLLFSQAVFFQAPRSQTSAEFVDEKGNILYTKRLRWGAAPSFYLYLDILNTFEGREQTVGIRFQDTGYFQLEFSGFIYAMETENLITYHNQISINNS